MTIEKEQNKMRISRLLFLVYWIVKAFYTQSSGGLQIGDYIFCLSFACYFFEVMGTGKISNTIYRDRLFFLFVMAVAFINVIYMVIYPSGGFEKAILYFIFNFLIVIEFRYLAESKSFLYAFFIATFLCLTVQIAVYFLGIGRYYGGGRYMGTFNDPNQLAFFIMSRFFLMYIVYKGACDKNKINFILMTVAFIMSIFLIMQSASTGMFLGFAVFVVAWLVNYIVSHRDSPKSVFMLLFLVAVIIFVVCGGDKLIFRESFLSDRIMQKIKKMNDGTGEGFIKDRNLGAFFAKPFYCLFGAGEGGFTRFTDYAANGELHSTVLSLLFYYGIVPYTVLVIWVLKNLKGITLLEMSVYVAIFIEMLTLVNHRQSSLWLLFILPSVIKDLEEKLSLNDEVKE